MIGTLIALAAALLFQIGLIGPFGLAGILVGKMLAQVVKIGYQVSRLGRERRSGAIGGLLRVGLALLPVVGVYLATAGLPLYLRAGIVVMALVLGVLLTRLVRPAEIRAVRMMRLERITLPDEG